MATAILRVLVLLVMLLILHRNKNNNSHNHNKAIGLSGFVGGPSWKAPMVGGRNENGKPPRRSVFEITQL